MIEVLLKISEEHMGVNGALAIVFLLSVGAAGGTFFALLEKLIT